jgi:hypothetical protein
MKKIIFTVSIILIGLFGKSNPLPVPPVISEIYFNGNTIQIEFFFEGGWWYDNFDDISIVSSTDTVEFINGINIYPNEIIVLDQNDLVGSFEVNPSGDHIYLIDEYGYPISDIEHEYLKFGNFEGAYVPAPNENQSIAFHKVVEPFYFEVYYYVGMEQPPTICSYPFNISTRGLLEGYIYDLNNSPVSDVVIIFPYYDPISSWYPSYSNQNGYFIMENLISAFYSLSFYKDFYDGTFTATIFPGDTAFIEIHLDTILVGIPEYQNHPNPFIGLTSFKIQIPNEINFNTAFLAIYNLSGKLIDRIQIPSRNLSVKWNSSGYKPGIYFYNLILDNKSFAAKKMIIR